MNGVSLEEATVSQLWDEIKKRFGTCILAGCRPDASDPDKNVVILTEGPNLHCMGLLQLSHATLKRSMLKTMTDADEDDVNSG